MIEDNFNRLKKKILTDVSNNQQLRARDHSSYHVDTPAEKEMRLLSKEIQLEHDKEVKLFIAELKRKNEELALEILKNIRESQKEREKQRTI